MRALRESLREGGQPQNPLLLEAILVRALDRNHEVNVGNAHGIGHDIEHPGGLDDVALADTPEHAADLNFRSTDAGLEPLANLLRKHNEYLWLDKTALTGLARLNKLYYRAKLLNRR